MTDLIVVGFKQDRERAGVVLTELRERDAAWTSALHGAIAVTSNAPGELRIDQSFEATKGEGAIVHAMLGSLLGIALATLALPLTAIAGATVAAGSLVAGALGGTIVGAHGHKTDEQWWREDIGIPDAFFARVGELVQPGDSAICLLREATATDDLAARFGAYGGTVIRAELTAEQSAKVRKRLVSA
ncbi:MAG TPA: DUF1269 domain-containing protein [Kofleriaceae bacterium]|jgi:uncharacterized membrane protein|nr:DUF1269 domain-containing protein [Kofleriaceae bacterium]